MEKNLLKVGTGGISEIFWFAPSDFKALDNKEIHIARLALNDQAKLPDIAIDYSKSQELFHKAMEVKNQLLLKVAKQILKREPVPEDYGKFQLVSAPGIEHEVFCYEGVRIGIIRFTYDTRDSFKGIPTGFEFVPDKDFSV